MRPSHIGDLKIDPLMNPVPDVWQYCGVHARAGRPGDSVLGLGDMPS